MGASYSHVTRAAGTTLTATIYNGDHQNHIDNMKPSVIDDYSSNAAEFQTVTDPAGALSTTLAGELERLRYRIKQLGRYLNVDTDPTYWYTTQTYPVIRVPHVHLRLVTAAAQTIATKAKTIPFTASDADWTVVTFDTADYNYPTMWALGGGSTPSGLITIVQKGLYVVEFGIEWGTGGGTAGYRVCAIRKNGSGGVIESVQTVPALATAADGTICQNGFSIIDCAAGATIELVVQQDSNATVTINKSQNYSPHLSATLVGGYQ